MFAIADENKNLLINGDNISGMKLIDGIRHYDFILINTPLSSQSNGFSYKENLGDDWENVLEERLSISKNLMTDSGSIAVYISNEEYLTLKSIMNRIFGKENYRNSFTFKRDNKSVSKGFEFLLVYSKTDKFQRKNLNAKGVEGSWKSTGVETLDFKGELCGWTQERGLRALANYKEYEENYVDKITLRQYWEALHRDFKEENGFDLEFIRANQNCTIENWINSTDDKIVDTGMIDWMTDEVCGKKAFGFETVNDIKTIIKIVDMFTDKNSKVLDYYAGIGDTGQAVLELNEKDGGDRVVTLITNNPSRIFPDMCYPRMREVCRSYGKELTYICLE
jgi:Adenine specific DNA methylase Mod